MIKIGDIVKLVTDEIWPNAIVVDVDPTGWFWVLQDDGVKRMWPPSQMRLVCEDR